MFFEEIKQNNFMCKKYKKVSTTLNYIEQILLFLTVIGCVWISALISLAGIPIGIPSFAGIKSISQ